MKPSSLFAPLLLMSGSNAFLHSRDSQSSISDQLPRIQLDSWALKASEDMPSRYSTEENFRLVKEVLCDPIAARQMLLTGADPNAINPVTGDSALHAAVEGYKHNNGKGRSNNLSLIDNLVRFGAAIKYRNMEGKNPVEKAMEVNSIPVALFMKHMDEEKTEFNRLGDNYLAGLVISRQKMDEVNAPKEAMKVMIAAVNSGINIKTQFNPDESIENNVQKNWPQDLAEQLISMSNKRQLLYKDFNEKEEVTLQIREDHKSLVIGLGKDEERLLAMCDRMGSYDKSAHFR